MNLDAELKTALRRTEAPDGFADRVLKRLDLQKKPRPFRPWMAIAATLAVGAVIPAGYQMHQHREREHARQAAQQLETALKIAGKKLHATKRQILRRTNGV